MPWVEEAQRQSLGRRRAREPGVQTGQRMVPLVQGPQDVQGIRTVAIADEGPFGLLVRVEGAGQVRAHLVCGTQLARGEGVPVESLSVGRDLRLDLGEFRGTTSPVRSTQPYESEPPSHCHAVILPQSLPA
ncbi:hypothetical protein BU52_16210 [Streptomyces toyocaensis]|uniref:Uncharacterized protein n=1 Tax=Streptomyces toyocaensis TaxID=55952 RepID=A0A081XRU6_STRTO|nr:hypothetical protein BU52_16210 [Streptomyces toyocaensis]